MINKKYQNLGKNRQGMLEVLKNRNENTSKKGQLVWNEP